LLGQSKLYGKSYLENFETLSKNLVVSSSLKNIKIPFTLRDLFNEVGMADLSEGLAKTILQNVTMGQRFTMLPEVTDNSNIDDEHRVTFNPLMEDSFISYLDGILKFESSFEGSNELKSHRSVLKEILIEPDHEKKIRSFFAFTLAHPAEYNNSIQ